MQVIVARIHYLGIVTSDHANGKGSMVRGRSMVRGQTEFQVNLKLGLTLRQEARERRIISKM